LLKSAGFQVKLFASAQEFLDFDPAEPEAVMILDLRMPGLHGREMQKILMDRGETVPIIFLTAFEDPQARCAALQRKAVAFLQKPVDEKVLFEAIKEAHGQGH